MGRLLAGEKYDFIDIKLPNSFCGDIGVTEVNGIECATDEANFSFLCEHERLGSGCEFL